MSKAVTLKAAREFYFMATVLERFEHLGLAHNNKILMIVGVHISNKFNEQQGELEYCRLRKEQQEGEEKFNVWDYPDWWLKEMDREIIIYLEHYLESKANVNG